MLDTVPYAAGGAWAVNLWMKPGSIYGDDFQYLFSHAADKFYATGWESNQASLFVAAILGTTSTSVPASNIAQHAKALLEYAPCA